ncbi:MAG: hypothetical protein ACM3VT_05330 [Solirubrobacterales bacterium]
MAQIVLSGDELVCILNANGLVPEEVNDIELAGQEIKLRIKTPWPIFKSIRVGLRFTGFEEGHVVLHLATNRLIDQFDWLVDKMLAGFPLANHGARWEYPRLRVDVNQLLRRHVRGIEVTNIAFEEGQFRITTSHVPDANRNCDEGGERPGDSPEAFGEES